VRLSLASRLVAREARGASGKILFFVACLAVGVAAVVTVAGLSDGVDRGIRGEARRLLAADLAIRAERPIPSEAVRAVEALLAARPGSRRASVHEMATIVSAPGRDGTPGPSALALLKGAEEGYPFYGEIRTKPEQAARRALGPDEALVAPELASKLRIGEGDTLRIGGRDFVVRGEILSEPDTLRVGFSLAPRVLISFAGLGRTELEAFGSRVDRTMLVALAGRVDAREVETAARSVRRALPESSGVRVQTYADAQPALRDGLRRAARFLGLVALVSLILGGIGVSQAVRAWLATRVDAIAVLRCLGVRPGEVVALYTAEAALLGLAGSVAGIVAGIGMLAVAPRVLSGVLPDVPLSVWQPQAMLRGLALGTGIALAFSGPPLSAVRLVPPLRVLRREAEPLRPGGIAAILIALVLFAGVWGAASIQSGSHRIAAAFTVGIFVAAALLAGAGRLLMAGASRISGRRVRVMLRYGLAALVRPGAGTLTAVTSLGLGVLVVVALALVERGLVARLRAELPARSPNVFLVDMQTAQWADVQRILADAGATHVTGVPIVNARLVSIDGVPVAELVRRRSGGGRREWILTREQNLTYMDALPSDNVVVEGKLWSDPGRAEISIERDFARDMGASLGSKVVFDVQGVPQELIVTSLRTVDWKSFGVNFFLVVEPGVLDRAPQMRVAAARVPAGSEQPLQDRLAAEFPNVTLLKVREIVEKVAAILDRLGLAVRLVGGFAILAGIAILAGAVGATASRRGREVALLKTLGATRGGVVGVFFVEFALTGLVAGLVGTSGGCLLAWGVLTRAMELEWTWRPLVLVAAPLGTIALSVIAGIAASASALRKRPIEALRSF